MKTTWNTGRQYGPEGQRITATLDRDRCEVSFTDHTRGIAGTFGVSGTFAFLDTEQDLQRFVMSAYDSNNYVDSHDY